jgi:hypothetical protein
MPRPKRGVLHAHCKLCRNRGMGDQRCHGWDVHGNNTAMRRRAAWCAGCSDLYLHIYHPVVPVVQRVGAIWRPYHDVERDGVLSEAIIRANGLRQLTPVPAAGLGGVERLVGPRNNGLRGLGGA